MHMVRARIDLVSSSAFLEILNVVGFQKPDAFFDILDGKIISQCSFIIRNQAAETCVHIYFIIFLFAVKVTYYYYPGL